jgi:HEPN domain-containing protein
MKGFISLKGGSVQKIHDLTSLNKYCVDFDKDFSEIADDCLNLTDYGIQTRYPFILDINEADAQLAMKSAEKVQDFLRKKMYFQLEIDGPRKKCGKLTVLVCRISK